MNVPGTGGRVPWREADMAGTDGAPWASSFQIEGDPSDHIVLKQMDGNAFTLGSTITYIGKETGLEGKLDPVIIDVLRWVSPERLPETDLASVPLPLRWLASNYGIHTPAAVIHNWMIDEEPVVGGLIPQYADRYFRFMLRDLGVRLIRRWMMWAAVALRTRWKTGARNQVSLSLWVIGGSHSPIVTRATNPSRNSRHRHFFHVDIRRSLRLGACLR
jgi:Protein of unknown function (DUF1353)